jgi:ABC-type transport system involved in multi-copper enzyme maturation permease subunit
MKFREIFRFEFGYQLRHVSTWLIFTFLFLFGFLMPRIGTPVDGVYLNSNAFIAFITVFSGVLWFLISGVIAGDAATLDTQTRMYSMIYTTPISKENYLGGRFLAAFVLNALIQLGITAGMLLSFYSPGTRTEMIGPFIPAAYLTAYGFIALPNVFVVTAIQFAIAQRSGRAMSSYIASVFLLIASHVISTSLDKYLQWLELEKAFDLVGIVNVASKLETWTAYESNTRLIELKGPLLWSRFLWMGVAFGALALTYYRFQFSHVAGESSKRGRVKQRKENPSELKIQNADSGKTEVQEAKPVAQPQRKFGLRTYAHQVLAVGSSSFIVIAKSRGGIIFIAVLSLGAALFSSEWMQFLGVPLFPRTEEVLRFFTPHLHDLKTLWVVIPFLTIVYVGEILWSARETGVNELSDTTPIPESALFIGQFLALTFMIITWMVLLMAGGVLIQVNLGYDNFELSVFVKALFGLQLVNYILFALLSLVVHVLINQKYLGHMVALIILIFIGFSSTLGVAHKLLVYGSDTGWSYSDMRGFSPFIWPWLLFKLYWTAWALLLAVAAILLWVRSKEHQLKARLKLAHHRFANHRWSALTAVVFLLIWGGFIFYNTNVLNKYSTASERMEQRAEYERRYGRYENIPQPIITGTKLYVDIYPGEREAKIRGTYRLTNMTGHAIDTIHLAVSDVEIKAISFNLPTKEVILDNELNHHIYTLKEPIQPGDSLHLNFEVHIKPNGFDNNGVNPSIVENGTYLRSQDVLPAIGYQENRRIRNAQDRKKYGLAPRPELPSLYNVKTREYRDHAQGIGFEAIVSTTENQIAIAPGALQRKWTKGGRSYFHYTTNAPIRNQYAFFSATYAVLEAEWVATDSQRSPVRIQIFHHATHHQNIDRMVRSIQASLQYYTQQFGPYPYNFFRVIERPGAGRGMHAEATTIDYMEGYSLMNPRELDLPFHIMAHEVAHQWWGMQLTPAFVEGLGVLVESFATFSAMQVVEETLGHEHLRLYLRQVREEYETPRSRFAPPLLQANNSFMNYRKGPFALHAMTQYIGKDNVNDVLRKLLKDFGSGKPPLPTTLDLYRELRAVTPDSLHYLVHDLFAANTYWELKTEQASAKEVEKNTWQVTLNVNARKVLVHSTGAEIELPMKDWLQIGIFGEVETGKEENRSKYLQMHRIKSGKQTITVTVPWKPFRAGIDPNHLMIDLEMEDNVERVKIED